MGVGIRRWGWRVGGVGRSLIPFFTVLMRSERRDNSTRAAGTVLSPPRRPQLATDDNRCATAGDKSPPSLPSAIIASTTSLTGSSAER